MLVIDLPAGVEVGVDGQGRQAVPIAPLEVEPGTHTLTLVTACQQLELDVETPAHAVTRIDRDRAAGLELATLEVSARNREGEALEHTVTIDGTVVGAGNGTSKVTVPACSYRVKVVSEALGGVIEDIDFRQEPQARRELVLSPGSDMVRIHGGRFTLGPPEGMKERWTDEEGHLMFPRIPVVVETFELDRSEVTAGQWHQCRAAASPKRCYSEKDCEHAVGCPQRAYLVTHLPHQINRKYCNADLVDVQRPVRPGSEHHPMNCVTRWEAEDYCRWIGKRLPSAIEWEYAARSGDERTLWPWGNDGVSCDRGALELVAIYAERRSEEPCGRKGTSPICSFPAGDSKHGVCDLVGNVSEHVMRAEIPGTARRPDDYACMGSSWQYFDQEPFRGGGYFEHHFLQADVGFRCARSIPIQDRGDQ